MCATDINMFSEMNMLIAVRQWFCTVVFIIKILLLHEICFVQITKYSFIHTGFCLCNKKMNSIFLICQILRKIFQTCLIRRETLCVNILRCLSAHGDHVRHRVTTCLETCKCRGIWKGQRKWKKLCTESGLRCYLERSKLQAQELFKQIAKLKISKWLL